MVFLLSLNHEYIQVNNIAETPYSGKIKKVQTATQYGLVGLAANSRYGRNIKLIFQSFSFIKNNFNFQYLTQRTKKTAGGSFSSLLLFTKECNPIRG